MLDPCELRRGLRSLRGCLERVDQREFSRCLRDMSDEDACNSYQSRSRPIAQIWRNVHSAMNTAQPILTIFFFFRTENRLSLYSNKTNLSTQNYANHSRKYAAASLGSPRGSSAPIATTGLKLFRVSNPSLFPWARRHASSFDMTWNMETIFRRQLISPKKNGIRLRSMYI